VAVDPEKIKEIMDWPAPINVSEVRSFMGLDGYYMKVYPRIFQDRPPNHFIANKRSEICVVNRL
jgi:hypothetical protein